MNPTSMMPQGVAPGLSPTVPAGMTPPGMPAVAGQPGALNGGLAQDSFSPQGAPGMPSEADMAALAQALGGLQGGADPAASGGLPAGFPGQMPPAPGAAPASAGLQNVPSPNGDMVLESAPFMPSAPAGPAGLSALLNPKNALGLAALAAGSFFLIKRLRGGGTKIIQNVTQPAIEKMAQKQDELFTQLKSKLGKPDEIDALATETKDDLKKAIQEHTDKLNGVDEKQTVATHLEESVDGLFNHARGLKEGDSLADDVTQKVSNAFSSFKSKVLGQAEDAAK